MSKNYFKGPAHFGRKLGNKGVPWGQLKAAPQASQVTVRGEAEHRIYPPVYMPQVIHPQVLNNVKIKKV